MNIHPGRFVRRIIRSLGEQVCVLMYHRIAEADTDPWDLCVSPAHFEQQLTWLQATGNILSVNELAQSLRQRKLINRGIVLTFDDGYEDNFTVARPLLEKYGIPATFFIPSSAVIQQQPFWWDELQQIIFETPALPSQFFLSVAGETLQVDVGNEAILTAEIRQRQQAWKATEPPVSKRCHLYLELWKKLRPLPHTLQQHVLHDIQAWAGISQSVEGLPPILSLAQLAQLVDHPLISIGAHTCSHPALGNHPPSVQYQEITENRALLTDWCNHPIESFAYPYGNYNKHTERILQNEKFTISFTTQAVPATNRTNRYKVGRIQVPDCTGEQLGRLLNQIL